MAAIGDGAGERQLAGEHLIEDHAHGVDVGAAVAALALHLLRSDVIGRAQHGGEVGVSEAPRGRVTGNAEIDELDVVVFVDHDVFRLEVAVDDAIGMDVVERLEHFDGDADGAVLRHTAFVEDLAQQPALAPLHDHVNAGALFVRQRRA